MKVYRLQKTKYGTDISGKGSNLTDGRWNIRGDLKILYTAENKSLALLEKIDSFSNSVNVALPSFTMLEIEVSDNKVIVVRDNQLPLGWSDANRKASQIFGMNWLMSLQSLAMSVPSVISGDRNILINPQHKDFKMIKVVSSIPNFTIDHRLIRK